MGIKRIPILVLWYNSEVVAKANKNREVLLCQLVADEINKTSGTDLQARAVDREPPDVMLISQSGQHAARNCEVVSAPRDFTIRYDTDNVHRLERTLRSALGQRNFSGYRIGIHWAGAATQHALKGGLDDLAALVIGSAPKSGYIVMDGVEIWDVSPRIASLVHYFSIFRLPCERLDINSMAAWWAPRDGRWIEEAVSAKIKKYGIGSYVASLTLVVDGMAYLDTEQIAAYRDKLALEPLPFADLWAVAMGKAYRLKPTSGAPQPASNVPSSTRT